MFSDELFGIGLTAATAGVAYFPRYHHTPYSTQQGIFRVRSGKISDRTGKMIGLSISLTSLLSQGPKRNVGAIPL